MPIDPSKLTVPSSKIIAPEVKVVVPIGQTIDRMVDKQYLVKPLLAPDNSPIDDINYFKRLQYPLLGSPKIDGIRAMPQQGVVFSRKLIAFRSIQVQAEYSDVTDLDGEMGEGCITDYDLCNRTYSHLMSYDKPGDLSFHVFDCVAPQFLDLPFIERYDEACRRVELYKGPGNVHVVPQKLVKNIDDLLEFEAQALGLGFEGLMLRDPFAPYVQKRATAREGIIFKLKRFKDEEGILVDFEAGTDNLNEQVRDNLGNAKRSKAKGGLVESNMVGTLYVNYKGEIIKVAPGRMRHDERVYMLLHPGEYIGRIAKFRHFPHGAINVPRFPRWVAWRDPMDM